METVKLSQKEILRYLGYRPGVSILGPRERELIDEARRLAMEAMRPAAVWTLPVDPERLGISDRIRQRIRGSQTVACFAVTAGAALDALIEELFAAQKPALAAAVDACGSAAAEWVARTVQQTIADRVKGEGGVVRIRLSPGYSGWPISANELLLRESGGAQVGIQVTREGLLIPRKSVLGIVPIFGMRGDEPCFSKS